MGKHRKRPDRPASDYAVGYGKPPVGSRWVPGQSGNPAGSKPKEPLDLIAKALATMERILLTQVTLTGPFGDTPVEALDGTFQRMVGEAMNDGKAAMKLWQLYAQLAGALAQGQALRGARATHDPAADREIVANAERRTARRVRAELRRQGRAAGPPGDPHAQAEPSPDLDTDHPNVGDGNA